MSKKIPIKMCMDILTFTVRTRSNFGSGTRYPYKNDVIKKITNSVIYNTKDSKIATEQVEMMVDLLNDKDSLGWD